MIGKKLGPYEILESIGSGGMGEVWKARDTRLGRTVAIKKVKEQHSERFKQEARSIAALNHPNICQIHDIGDDYLVLEYVEGKPLPNPLPEQEAVRLAIQVASALEAAHKKGIIHRDLKPSNIMVTAEGSVKLLDFGLAKLYAQDASISSLPTEDAPATQAGAMLGTVAYMSPEQAQGRPVDARSDIFSFGLVLYEMLSGRRAFSGSSASETVAALLRDDPSPLRTSLQLERIVKRCLKKNPSKRYQTMPELRAALEKTAEKKRDIRAEETQPSIAVLPFVNMSGDKEQEYFSDGLAEEIINALTKIPGLKVTARTSAFAFRGKEQDIIKIAEALRVKTILEGSVRKAGDRVRITAQLINAADGFHLWSERYDRNMTDVFEIQDEISTAIAGNLRVRLSGNRSVVKRHTNNLDAYNLYLKARYHQWKFLPEEFEKSKKYYEQAISHDPNFALAWTGLGIYYHLLRFVYLMPPDEADQLCQRIAMKALELDSMLPQAHLIKGINHGCDFDWEKADQEFQQSLMLGPEEPDVLGFHAMMYLLPLGRLEDSLTALKRVLDMDPLSTRWHNTIAIIYCLMRQYDRAIEHCIHALELEPHELVVYFTLSVAEVSAGKVDKAIEYSENGIQLIGRNPLLLGVLGLAYARLGHMDDSKRLIDELQQLSEKEYVPPLSLAHIHLGLQDIEKCFEYLERAVEAHDFIFILNHASPIYDPLRSHPRYKALLRKMNLEP